jgi:ABC-type nitrate/sulfonate/bicarbonate transport system substrate-binding protein
MTGPLRIGFIPLVDAAALIVAVDKGFAAAEGLDVALVREVSWSNVRDKLNIGLFDAAHLLAPVAIASSLGLGHVKVPIVAPFNLGINGNAITVSPGLHAAIMKELSGDPFDPMATALALSRVVAARRKSGAEPLTFGMTFPFSTHNYQLRFWMAAGGVDPAVMKEILKEGIANSSVLQLWRDLGPRWKNMLKATPPGITPPNMRKDLHMVLELAGELGVNLYVGTQASLIADAGVATGHDDPRL